MPQPEVFGAVFELERRLGASWPHIRAARTATLGLHERLSASVKHLSGEDASLVVFGSAGRFEVTSESDTDWTYLVDGQADAKHQEAALKVGEAIHRTSKKPGREGVFGSLTFSHDLIHHIGGQGDTNANLTRRILLLLESRPIGRREAYDRVLMAVLDRYLSGDRGWLSRRNPHGVPRFLQNDVARYWRTVTVDFAYKSWTRDERGWALRRAKLRLSRKLTYAAGLLYCFSLAEDAGDTEESLRDSARKQRAIERLCALTGRTPLDLLAEAFMKDEGLADQALSAFGAYDAFLECVGDSSAREHFERLSPDEADGDEQYQQVRGLGGRFQKALTALFIHDNATRYPELTKVYGVF